VAKGEDFWVRLIPAPSKNWVCCCGERSVLSIMTWERPTTELSRSEYWRTQILKRSYRVWPDIILRFR
jgi:hypothetical protein